MIASANLVATVLGVIGSLVQARFIDPETLGFIRKYDVVASNAVFLSLGLFTIIQREYLVLIGRGEPERARQAVAIGQSWCLSSCGFVSCWLLVMAAIAAAQSQWRTAAAWSIQIVSVWSVLYVGFLATTYRSGQQFERLAKGTFFSSAISTFVLPIFLIWPFAGLVLRSVLGSTFSGIYLHLVRPVQVKWFFSLRPFFQLVKRSLRLFIGTFLRYNFWLTVEIWLMLRFAGDKGVGLMMFSIMTVAAMKQLSNAINQVYMPKMAYQYGQTGRIADCLRLVIRPMVMNFLISICCIVTAWFLFPHVFKIAFPKYVPAVPLINIMLLDLLIVALSLPVYMVSIIEAYGTQLIAAIIGLAMFVGLSFLLYESGLGPLSVIWGSIAGRFVFAVISILSIALRHYSGRLEPTIPGQVGARQ